MVTIITLDFSIQVETNLGEEVFVSGNIHELGSWDISKALKLETSKELYPEWMNKRSIFTSPNISIEFKVFIQASNGTIKWEEIEGNRKFVPAGPVIINFTSSKPGMIYEPRQIREELNIRKNTFEIIHDLKDELSESSSGNEREFWLERVSKEKVGFHNSKQIISSVKNLLESWENGDKEIKLSYCREWMKIISPIHFIINKEKCHTFKKYSKTKKTHHPQTDKNIPFDVYEVVESELETFTSSKLYPEKNLKFFHIEQEEKNNETILKIKKFHNGFFILHLNEITKIGNKELLNQIEMIVIRNKNTLSNCLEYFNNNKNNTIRMVKMNRFLISINGLHSILVYFNPKLTESWSNLEYNKEYLSIVEKNMLNPNLIHFPDNLRLSLLLESNILHKINKEKFTLAFSCEKISEIPEKILATLIRASSCENITVHILTTDQLAEIYKRIPISEKDKVYVYNTYANIFQHENKSVCSNFYQELNINVTIYEQMFNNLIKLCDFWIQNCEVQIQRCHKSPLIKFECENTIIGESVSNLVESILLKNNTTPNYPYAVIKYLSGNSIFIEVKPLICSHEFYSKLITSIEFNECYKTNILSFEFGENKYRFIEKIQQHCQHKGILHEGFIVPTQKWNKHGSNGSIDTDSSINSTKSIKLKNVSELLNELISVSESSIIEDEKEECRENRENREIESFLEKQNENDKDRKEKCYRSLIE